MAKSIFASKTFWVNVAAVVFLALQSAGVGNITLNPEVIAFVVALVNIALRYVTTTPVTLLGEG